jgi:hypothetical protein
MGALFFVGTRVNIPFCTGFIIGLLDGDISSFFNGAKVVL